MARNIFVTKSNEVTVSDDAAETGQESYDALKDAPVTNLCNIDFPAAEYADKGKVTAEMQAATAARKFGRELKAWAENNDLKYTRKGDIGGNPTRLTYRIYAPKSSE